MVYAHDLGSCGETRGGSTPLLTTLDQRCTIYNQYMANTSALPTQPKQGKINPREMLGGFLGEIMENVTGVPQSFEAQEPITTSVPEYVQNAFSSPEERNSAIGGQTKIEFNRLDEYQYQQTLNKVGQITQARDIQEEIRLNISGMSDEEFAEEADYNNTSYRGLLKTLTNKVYVALKLMAGKLGLIKEKTNPAKIISTRGKGFQMGENELLLGQESKGHFTQVPG